LAQFYEAKGQLVTVNADQTLDAVTAEIIRAVEGI
jgi:adenylate kinase family enzyme